MKHKAKMVNQDWAKHLSAQRQEVKRILQNGEESQSPLVQYLRKNLAKRGGIV